MTTTVYDSTDPFDIPGDAPAVLGYDDGPESAWPAAGWERFAGVPQIHLSTDFDTDAGDGWDAEGGNVVGPTDPRIRQKHQRLLDKGVGAPWGYCSKSWWGALIQQVAGLPVRWVVADWTGEPHLLPGADVVQYASPGTGSGGHFDLSLARDGAFLAVGLVVPVPATQLVASFNLEDPAVRIDTYRMSVQIGSDGHGFALVPDGVNPGRLLAPVMDDVKPDAPGVGYHRIPVLAGVATGPAAQNTEGKAELVFGPSGDGPAPAGWYGFTIDALAD